MQQPHLPLSFYAFVVDEASDCPQRNPFATAFSNYTRLLKDGAIIVAGFLPPLLPALSDEIIYALSGKDG